MSKMIKTTDTQLCINESNIIVVEVGMNSFEKDERFPWVNVYGIGDESKEFITEIDTDEACGIINCEELKVFALNWYFKNVEIVKEINKEVIQS